jgi:hypothetical protein
MEVSLPHSQQLATSPYPEPLEYNPHHPGNLPRIHIDIETFIGLENC